MRITFFGSTLQKIFLGHFSPGWITPKDRDSSSAKHEVAWDVTRKNIVRERKALSSVDFYEWPKDKKTKRKKINWKCFHFNPGHPLVAPVTKDPPRKVIIKRWHTAGSSSRRRWHWSRTTATTTTRNYVRLFWLRHVQHWERKGNELPCTSSQLRGGEPTRKLKPSK